MRLTGISTFPKHSVTHGITDVSKFNQKTSVTDTLLFN